MIFVFLLGLIGCSITQTGPIPMGVGVVYQNVNVPNAFGMDDNTTVVQEFPLPGTSATITTATTHTSSYDSHRSKCGAVNQRYDFFHAEGNETATTVSPNPAASIRTHVYNGKTTSTGNVLLPATVQTAGIAASGAFAPGTSIAVGATATGGKVIGSGNSKSSAVQSQGQTQDQKSSLRNTNSNVGINTNTNTLTGTATSSSGLDSTITIK
ncbi:MAG: hypothetical protein WCV59_05335 [Parcubacteria group bacterium]